MHKESIEHNTIIHLKYSIEYYHIHHLEIIILSNNTYIYCESLKIVI